MRRTKEEKRKKNTKRIKRYTKNRQKLKGLENNPFFTEVLNLSVLMPIMTSET